ncbi:MAG: parallel beta-helix domain-containing protein, partial [Bacteroidota bacterium]
VLILIATVLGILLISGFSWWEVSDYQVYEDRSQKSMDQFIDLEDDFQKLFQLAEDGDTIQLPAGHFKFTKALILDGKSRVTVKGAGIGETVLTFRGQTEGAEGIRIANGSNIVLEDFTIQDAIGDNIKAIYIDTLTFRRIKTEWTDIPNPELGAYGIYPVICKNILIEECEALRASDSGIYVGQSEKIVIRNNKTLENVCGINVENSSEVDIYGNEVFHNTSGMTALDIPGLTRYMYGVKIHDNKIYSNNLYNFAPAGNVAASTLPGTGITIWAGKGIEVYDNEILDNGFPICMISFLASYKLSKDKPYVPIAKSEQARMEVSIEEETSLREDAINEKFTTDKDYDPHNIDVFIGENTWSFGPLRKKMQSTDGTLFALALGNKDAHIWYDGVENPNGKTLCIQASDPLIVANLDIMNDSKNVGVDPNSYDCSAI